MYGNTLSREADLPCKVWRSLPPEPAEQSGLSTEDYDNCSAESDYDSISLPRERKTPAKPLGPDVKAVTGPSICSPAQRKKYWKTNQISVLLILTVICLLLIVLFLLCSNTSMLLELKSLNLSSTKEGYDASPAPFNFTEVETNFITKLKSLEQRLDEKRNSLQKMEEQLLRIEIKLNRLQNCRDILWRIFETNAYYFSDTEEKWEMAKEKCAERDSHLVIINTKKEQDFVAQNLKHSIWLGLSDTEKEGTWRWVDGSLLAEHYVSWRRGEPNNGQNGEDCAVLYKEGNWNDIRCDKQVKFVCEKENVSVY